MQKIVRDLVRAVGLGGALEIIQRWGGRALYVPLRVRRFDPLALTLGMEVASKLVAEFGGKELELPLERNALLQIRNRMIARDHAAGMSYQQIGLRYGLQRQAVDKILRAVREQGQDAELDELVAGIAEAGDRAK